MAIETQTTEVDFEYFLSIFHELYKITDQELQDTFVTTLTELEKALQDLDIPNSSHQHLWSAVNLKLKYWQYIFQKSAPFFTEFSDQKKFFIEALIYSLSFLTIECRKALLEKNPKDILRIVQLVLPRPNEYFTENLDNLGDVQLSPLIILIKQFLENYVKKFFGDPEISLSPRYSIFYSELLNAIEGSELYKKVQENHIKELIDDGYASLFPVHIYLDTNNHKDIEIYYSAVKKLISSLGLELVHEFEPKRGSWIRKLILRTKKIATSEEVLERLKKIEHGLEVNTINKTQSEIDKNQAEAISTILNASTNIPKLATLIGSLLIVKVLDEKNQPVVFVRTLTTKELIYLNENPELIQDPAQVIKKLNVWATNSSSMTLP